jgi:uncharacterized protein YjiS (DUF1127 family)
MTNPIVNRYRTWRKYRQTCRELMQLTSRELDDIGINRADIRAIARENARL